MDQLQTDTSITELQKHYLRIKEQKLALDMTRGKPSPEQLDLARPMTNILGPDDFLSINGEDCRNYGGLDGLAEAKELFGAYLGVQPNQVLIGGNSSLALMHDTLLRAWLKGVPGSSAPWSQQVVKFICVVPGYDRHFAICELLGIQMISVPCTGEGPDMEQVERLVKEDPTIKGMWCVPKYSNPTGETYSDTVITALAKMPTAAPDFRLFWDNAYQEHHLYPEESSRCAEIPEIIELCSRYGNPNRAIVFGSTSKISWAGAGIALLASSLENLGAFKKLLAIQTIGPDKMNQLRHVRFFENIDGLKAHMRRHAEILRPKFAAVHNVLAATFQDSYLCSWSQPNGGYFITLELKRASAKAVVQCAAELGVKLTQAGATHPHLTDPSDSFIRIAPSMPTLAEVERATEVLALAILLKSER